MRISDWSSDVCSSDLIARREVQGAARPLALVHLPDELGDAVDQNILVVDRRQPFDAGDDFELVAVMLVAEHAPIGLGRERENRMLHRGHVILGDGVENIANEQIGIGIANRQQRSEENTSEIQSLMRISYAVFCWKKQKKTQ